MAETGNNALRAFNTTITNARTQDYLKSVLGKKSQQFVTSLTSIVGNNTNLQACEPMSLIYAATKAASLDLPVDPNLGYSYVIPFKNNKLGITEAQFQVGWRGMLALAIRSGQVKTINVTDIREGEYQGKDLRSGQVKLVEIEDRESKPIVGFYGYIQHTNMFEHEIYWTMEQMEAHAKKYSQSYASKNDYVRKNSLWSTAFTEMAKKTLIKQLMKWAPLSIEVASAVQHDQAVFHADGTSSYDDNDPDTARNNAIAERANTKEIDMDDAVIVDETIGEVIDGGAVEAEPEIKFEG